MREYESVPDAWRTLQGIEAVHTIRKEARCVGKGDSLAQLQFIDAGDLTLAFEPRPAVAHSQTFRSDTLLPEEDN